MATIGTDTFTDTDATELSTHTPDTGGDWEICSGHTGTFDISNANRCRNGSVAARRAYWKNDTPASAEYDITAIYRQISTTNRQVGIAGRVATDGSAGYYVHYIPGTTTLTLRRLTGAGTQTELGTYTVDFGTGADFTIKLEIRDAAKKVYVDGVERISSADNTTTAAGFPGLIGESTNAGLNTNGTHIDNYQVDDLSGAAITGRLIDGRLVGGVLVGGRQVCAA